MRAKQPVVGHAKPKARVTTIKLSDNVTLNVKKSSLIWTDVSLYKSFIKELWPNNDLRLMVINYQSLSVKLEPAEFRALSIRSQWIGTEPNFRQKKLLQCSKMTEILHSLVKPSSTLLFLWCTSAKTSKKKLHSVNYLHVSLHGKYWRCTLGAVSSTFGLFSISHNPSLKPFRLLGLAYFSLLGRYGKMSFGPRNALFERR